MTDPEAASATEPSTCRPRPDQVGCEILLSELERQQLAAEVHDTLLQHLVTGKLLLESVLAPHDQSPSNAAAQKLQLAREQFLAAISCCHELLDRSQDLEDQLQQPLCHLLGGLVERLRSSCPMIRIELELPPQLQIDDSWPPIARKNILRIAEEAVRNALKHASADSIRLSLSPCSSESAKWLLEVCDNGCGFEPQCPKRQGRFFGLKAMQYRAALLGAQLHVESTPQQGTRVASLIPSPPSASEVRHSLHSLPEL
jgi:signal transduction histidine kinase